MFEEKKGGTNKLFLWFCFGDRVSIGLGRTSRSMGICSVELIGRWESVLCFCQKNVEGEGGNKQTLFCGSCFRDRFSIGFAGRTSRLMRILFWFAVFCAQTHKRHSSKHVRLRSYALQYTRFARLPRALHISEDANSVMFSKICVKRHLI